MADIHSSIPSADARYTASDAQVGDCESQAMTLVNPSQLIVAVVGPTASGKSDLALDLAEELGRRWEANGGQIVSADALQLYRGMDVGTAKTPVEERRGIPHYQLDVLDISQEASVAHYQTHARADLETIHGEGSVAIVAGGSGLYQRALLDHIEFPGTDPKVRSALEEEAEGPLGSRGLHGKLEALDPVSASRIDPHNVRRIIRALEVIELTGKPYSSHMPVKEFVKPSVMIAIRRDLDELDRRIVLRTQMMFNDGLIEETRALIDQGLRDAKTASKATGYAQAIAVIDGQMTIDEAKESIAIATRQLARRQIKWLRPDHRVIWIDAEEDTSKKDLLDRACEIVQKTADDYAGAQTH